MPDAMSGESQPAEVVLARLRPHGRALFWPSLLLIAIAAAAGFFLGRIPEPWGNEAIVAAAAVLALICWLFPLLSWLSRNYTITSRRVVIRSGILVRVRQEVTFARSFHVTVRRSVGQRLFGSGDVVVSGDADASVVLRDVPKPGLVQAALTELIDEASAGSRYQP
jgi:uncharacterized membrane protein YdbT with pleckstrin-like domain